MREATFTGTVTYSARTFGGGAGSLVTAAPQWPQRKVVPCTRNLCAELPPGGLRGEPWRRVTWRATLFHEDQAQGPRALHERDDGARLPAGLAPRLRRILFRLQKATHSGGADAPGFRLHPLKDDRAGQWSVRVSGNWCVVFRFKDGEAVDVDLIDYH